MGGDRGVGVTVPAAGRILARRSDLELVLVGDSDRIEPLLSRIPAANRSKLRVLHTDTAIGDGDSPGSVLRSARESSMFLAADMVKSGDAQAMVSAGNSGALLMIGRHLLKTIPGIHRPAMVGDHPGRQQTEFPARRRRQSRMRRATPVRVRGNGFGAGGKPQPGSGQSRPAQHRRRALQGNRSRAGSGRKAGKVPGRSTTSASSRRTRSITARPTSWFVTGFVGNVTIKASQGVANVIRNALYHKAGPAFLNRISRFFFRPRSSIRWTMQINPERFNGACLPARGLQGNVVKSHGNASVLGFCHAIPRSRERDRQPGSPLDREQGGDHHGPPPERRAASQSRFFTGRIIMRDFAVVFPGQGSQKTGMLAGLAGTSKTIESTFAEASEVIGLDLWEIIQHDRGPDARSDADHSTRPAGGRHCALAAVAAAKRRRAGLARGAQSRGIFRPGCRRSAGIRHCHRCSAQAGDVHAAGGAARRRRHGRDHRPRQRRTGGGVPQGPGGRGGRGIPRQITTLPARSSLPATRAAVKRAMQMCLEAGARRALPVKMSVPSHCELMEPARRQLETELTTLDFRAARFPVVQNVNGRASSDPDELRENLIEQICRPVRWIDCIGYMSEAGITPHPRMRSRQGADRPDQENFPASLNLELRRTGKLLAGRDRNGMTNRVYFHVPRPGPEH